MKEFFKKIWQWIKTHVVFAAAAASVLIVAIVLAIALPLALNSGNNSSSSSSSSLSSENSSSSEEATNYMYRIEVQNPTGYGLAGVKVTLSDNGTELASTVTSVNGYATFMEEDLPTIGEYEISLEMPKGYDYQNKGVTYKTYAQTNTEVIIPLMPTGVIKETAPLGTKYKHGDVMYDFTITDCVGESYNLSQLLEEKELVMLNFWYVQCYWCNVEFPDVNNAYLSSYNEEKELKYSDVAEILAISIQDNQAAVANYKSQNNLAFPMFSLENAGNVAGMFTFAGAPTTVLIDRYGVVSFIESGAFESTKDVTEHLDPFLGDEYTPTVIGGSGSGSSSGDGGSSEIEKEKPNVANPPISEIKNVLSSETNDLAYAWDEDEYSWPWLISEDKQYLYASNIAVHNSYAILHANFTAEAGKAVCFDFRLDTEKLGNGGDFFYVMLDGALIHQYAGEMTQWQTCYAYVFEEHEAGEHQLSIVYMKDGDTSAGDDMVQIRNVRFEDESTLDTPEVNVNIIRQAATQLNTDENAATQFKSYVTPVYNDEDGYYHANSADGPVLFANVLLASNWNAYSIWTLAANNYCVVDGVSLKDEVETMAWEANNNPVNHGYTPVTKKWKNLLDDAVYSTTFGKKWAGEYHGNEWLELCVYYDHYGDTPVMEDPMKNITYNAATTITEGTTRVNVPFALNPRGFKYKFVPTRSGAFKVYSTGDIDSECFLADDSVANLISTQWNNYHFLGIYEDVVWATKVDETGAVVADRNFSFHFFFEQGKTYYFQFATKMDDTAEYDVTIEYIGETYSYLENAASHWNSFNEITNEFYVLDAVKHIYADPTEEYTYANGEKAVGDGYYHVLNANGTVGSILYLDTFRPTMLFNSQSLNDIVEDAKKYPDVTKRAFYINGKDYTPLVQQFCFKASKITGELNGFLAVDQEVYDVIRTIAMAHDGFGIDNSWLKLCYYYYTLQA